MVNGVNQAFRLFLPVQFRSGQDAFGTAVLHETRLVCFTWTATILTSQRQKVGQTSQHDKA